MFVLPSFLLFYPTFTGFLGQWVGLIQATLSLLKSEILVLIFMLIITGKNYRRLIYEMYMKYIKGFY